jgi:hypothetical protein
MSDKPEASVDAAAMAAMVISAATVKGLKKFAGPNGEDANEYGITNDRGQVVTTQYLARYIQCWCRTGDGYIDDRKANFAYFMSHAFLSAHATLTASQVGKAAASDPRWNRVIPAGEEAAKKSKTAALVPFIPEIPAAGDPLAGMILGDPTATVQNPDDFAAKLAEEIKAEVAASKGDKPMPVIPMTEAMINATYTGKRARAAALKAAKEQAATAAATAANGGESTTVTSTDDVPSLA